MFSQADDTIVAISSAPGPSPRGVLRLSGDHAIELAAGLFTRPVDTRPGFRRHRGEIRWGGEAVNLPAELFVFRAPRSFTKQDMAEIHTLGSPPVLASLLDELLDRGARLAEPGEFTGRAFLAGAMDLTAVEGIGAMISAVSDAQLRAAEQLLHGTLARQTQRLHSRIVDLLSLVEASIDFVEEPIDFLSPEGAAEELGAVVSGIADVLGRAVPLERLDTRHRVVLFGPSNVGKSTLFNRLTGLDRAICSPQAGTTRDVIAAPVSLGGASEAWLVDSAGVAGAGEGIERQAAELARQAATGADAVLFVVDGGAAIDPQLAGLSVASRCVVIVINKIDVLRAEQVSCVEREARRRGHLVCAVSAATGAGCSDLLTRLSEVLYQGGTVAASATSLAVNARHQVALTRASEACSRAIALLRHHKRVAETAELIALELREANTQLGAIVGEAATEDLLGQIFSRFCIGK